MGRQVCCAGVARAWTAWARCCRESHGSARPAWARCCQGSHGSAWHLMAAGVDMSLHGHAWICMGLRVSAWAVRLHESAWTYISLNGLHRRA
eukprot:364973-Chlamydomonas_euryale.AAC.7